MTDNDQFKSQEQAVLLRELESILNRNISGDVVELGCYKGLTSLKIQQLLSSHGSSKRLFLYDSFAGLPNKTTQDESPVGVQFKAGELPAAKREVVNLFKRSGLSMPVIKKAWFYDLSPADLPDKISLAFLDGDFYESVMDSLRLVWPKLSDCAVVIVDDYQNEALPGAQKAVDEWLKTHPARLKHEASLAVILPG